MTKKLLMGNEAFAHAALEAGVSVVAGYPGTPSSELVETVARMNASGRAKGVHVEWSTNEKAALEVCAAASMSGARALFTCKQVGMNVASDALMSLNYVGVRGGLVLFVADDPGPISSQTEQDTRRFAKFAKVPVFDPATPEQGYIMMKAAFELSEEYNTPVIVRPTTRIDHASTFFDVEDTTVARALPRGGFKHDADRWVIFPKRAYEGHAQINERLRSMVRMFSLDPNYAQFFPMFDKMSGPNGALVPLAADSDASAALAAATPEQPYVTPSLGIMCGGVSTQYAREALELLERWAARAGTELPPYRFIQMGIAYPFTNRAVRRFMEGLNHVLVLEELDSVLEEELIVAASGRFLSAHVHGKMTGEAPTRGENSTESLVYAIAHFFDEYGRAPVSEIAAIEAAVKASAGLPTGEASGGSAAGDAGAASAKDESGLKDRRGSRRAPDHVREEPPEPQPRLGLIGVAAELHANEQAQAAERMERRRVQNAANRRPAQSSTRRRQAHAARYRSPATRMAIAPQTASDAYDAAAAASAAEANRRTHAPLLGLVERHLGTDALLRYQGSLPPRPPVLCAGCPHRGSFYAIKGALDKLGVRRDDAILCGDIGCYTLGNALPLAAVDTCLCMGAGITMAQGFHIAEPGKKQVAFVGDSTFFASGMTGVVNAVYNGHDVTFAILDNATTAMTGSQPHPGTGMTLMGERRKPIPIDAILKAMGVEMIVYADPLDRTQAEQVAVAALRHAGPSAIIFQSPCVWMKQSGIPAEVDPETCTGCKRCITDLGCPAIAFNAEARGRKSGLRGQAMIDPDLCNGCGLCTQVCPFGAISIPSMLDYAARDQAAVRVGKGTARQIASAASGASAATADEPEDERPGIEDIGSNEDPPENEPAPEMGDDPQAPESAEVVDEDAAAEGQQKGAHEVAPSSGIRNKEVGSVQLDPFALFGGALTLQIGGADLDADDSDDAPESEVHDG